MSIKEHFYESLIAENKALRKKIDDLIKKLDDEQAALKRFRATRSVVLKKVGLKDRVKSLFGK